MWNAIDKVLWMDYTKFSPMIRNNIVIDGSDISNKN